MQVRVTFLGALEDATGCAEALADLPSGAVMEDLMAWLDSQFGHKMSAEMWDRQQKRFGPMTMVFLNGSDVEDYRRPLLDGSEVICTMMMAGG